MKRLFLISADKEFPNTDKALNFNDVQENDIIIMWPEYALKLYSLDSSKESLSQKSREKDEENTPFLKTTAGKMIGAIGIVTVAAIVYKLIKRYQKQRTTNRLSQEQQEIVQNLTTIFDSTMPPEEQEQAQATLFSSYNYSASEQQALINIALLHRKQPN